MRVKQEVDVQVSGGGTVYLFEPLTEAAKEWIEANVGGEMQWLGSALAVEHRYAAALAVGMLNDGLKVR